MEGHNWFLNHFVEIPRKSIFVGFIVSFGKNQFNHSTIWDQLFLTTVSAGGEGGGCTPFPFHYIYHHV
jgi:hypothetical protein